MLLFSCSKCSGLEMENNVLKAQNAILKKKIQQFEELETLNKVEGQGKRSFDLEIEDLKKKNEVLLNRIAIQQESAARLREELTTAQDRITALEDGLSFEEEAEWLDDEEIDESSEEDSWDEESEASSEDDGFSDNGEEENLKEQLETAETANVDFVCMLGKSLEKVEGLEEKIAELQERNSWLEKELDERTAALFDYISRYPQFVEHKTLEEAQVEIDDLRCQLDRLREEKEELSNELDECYAWMKDNSALEDTDEDEDDSEFDDAFLADQSQLKIKNYFK